MLRATLILQTWTLQTWRVHVHFCNKHFDYENLISWYIFIIASNLGDRVFHKFCKSFSLRFLKKPIEHEADSFKTRNDSSPYTDNKVSYKPESAQLNKYVWTLKIRFYSCWNFVFQNSFYIFLWFKTCVLNSRSGSSSWRSNSERSRRIDTVPKSKCKLRENQISSDSQVRFLKKIYIVVCSCSVKICKRQSIVIWIIAE